MSRTGRGPRSGSALDSSKGELGGPGGWGRVGERAGGERATGHGGLAGRGGDSVPPGDREPPQAVQR